MFNTINRYILKELLAPFIISLFFLTFVFLMTRIPEITNMVVNYNADIRMILLMIVYTMPRFLEFTIPMSVMVATLLTFMRMAGDNEIVALKGAGVSLYRLLPPVLLFCFAGVMLSMWVTIVGVSWGKLALKKISVEIARSSADAALKERQFNSEIEDVMIYVAHVDMKTRTLQDVFIEDRRTKGVVSVSVAPEGDLIKHKDEQFYTIRLHNGVINQVDMDQKSVNSIQFGNYDINIDLDRADHTGGKINIEMDERGFTDLVKYLRSGMLSMKAYNEGILLLHEKFSLPFACLALGILAFPLGIQAASLRKSSGFGMGVSFFLLYYCLLAFGWSAGEAGEYHPAIAMWLPNCVIGVIAICYLVSNAKEKPVRIPGFVKNIWSIIKQITTWRL